METKYAGYAVSMQRLTSLMERLLIRFAREIVVVSPSIRAFYEARYRRPVTLIINVPSRVQSNGVEVRELLSIGDAPIVMYAGGSSRRRGTELLLEAVDHVSPHIHFAFMGSGDLEEEITASQAARPNVHCQPAVRETQVVPTVAYAGLSFSVNDRSSLNHQFSLPSIFFRSLMAGVPILVNKENVNMLTVGATSAMMFGVEHDVDQIAKFTENVFRRDHSREPQDFSWESQKHLMLEIYRKLATGPKG